jgi:hypothetical protein
MPSLDPHIKFARFIERIKELDYTEAYEQVLREAARHKPFTGRSTLRQPKALRDAIRQSNIEYFRLLQGLCFWIENGSKAAGLNDGEFRMLRPLCEAFVNKKVYKPKALAVFDSPESSSS